MKKNRGRELKGKVQLPRGGKGLSAGPPALGSRECLLPNSPVSLPGHICMFAEQADCFGQATHTCVPTEQAWFPVATSLYEYRKQLEAPTGAHLGTSHDGSLKGQCSVPGLKLGWWQQARSSQEGPWGTKGKVGSEQVEIASLSPRQTHHRTRLLTRPWHMGTGKEWAAEPGGHPERKPTATSIWMTPK